MTKAVVVGGGLIGMLTAYGLLEAGWQVELLEKGQLGRESSWAGGGILSPLYPWRYADPITELARWSQAHYESFAETLISETGIDPEWTKSGLLMLDLGDAERGSARTWAQRHGYVLEMLSPEEVAVLVPRAAATERLAAWMPEVAQVRNPRLLRALKQLLLKKGITIVEQAPVDGFETENGRVIGVKYGEQHLFADKVVLCGGAWSGKIASQLGFDLSVEPVKGQMLLFRAEPGLLSHIVLSEGYYLIPRRDGRILAGSTLEHVGFDKSTTDAAREELYRQAIRILPALEEVELERQWAGLRPGSSDGVPFIGEVPGFRGLYINAGHYRNGVVMGLASARLVVDIITGAVLNVDPTPYQL